MTLTLSGIIQLYPHDLYEEMDRASCLLEQADRIMLNQMGPETTKLLDAVNEYYQACANRFWAAESEWLARYTGKVIQGPKPPPGRSKKKPLARGKKKR